jgi:hypothetical protein
MIQYQTGSRKRRTKSPSGLPGVLAIPTEDELKAVNVFRPARSASATLPDLAWALVNSPEFLYRH